MGTPDTPVFSANLVNKSYIHLRKYSRFTASKQSLPLLHFTYSHSDGNWLAVFNGKIQLH